MASPVVIVCLALIACVVCAPGPGHQRRYYDGGYNLGGGGGGFGGGFGGFGGPGGHGGHGYDALGPHPASQSFSKSSASASSVSGGVSHG